MRIIYALCIVLMLVSVQAFAVGYHNDCSSTTDWYVFDAPLVSGGQPVVTDGGTAVTYTAPTGTSGYMIARLGDTTSGTPAAATAKGLAQCSTGTPIDCTNLSMKVRARVTYTGTGDPPLPASLAMGIWVRVYCGNWDAVNSKWTLQSRAGWFMPLNMNDPMTDSPSFDLNVPGDGTANWDPSKVYALRFDLVYWDAAYSPCEISFDDVNIYQAFGLKGNVYAGAGTGTPLAGVSVQVNGSGGPTKVTNAAGAYWVPEPPTGSAVPVLATGTGYLAAGAYANITAGADTTQDFHLSTAPTGGLPVFIPMDQQINLNPFSDPAANAIFSANVAANFVSFEPAGTYSYGDETEGWAREHIVTAGWYYGPYVDLRYAGVTPVDITNPRTAMDIDVRYFQDPATNSSANADAPIFLRMYSYTDTTLANGGYRDYSVFYAVQSGDAPYPAWTHKTVILNNLPQTPYTQANIGTGTFDPTNVTRARLYGSAWGAGNLNGGIGTDWVDAKNFQMSVLPSALSGYVYGSVDNSVPLAGATVNLTGGQHTTTDANGYYVIVNPLVGTGETVAATAFGYFDGAETVDIPGGTEVVQDIHLVQIPTCQLSGHVYGGTGTGNPLSGATVRIVGGASTTTDGNGYYNFATAPSAMGVQVQAISAPAFSAQAVTIDLPEGGNVTQDFNLTAAPTPGLPVFIPMDQQLNFNATADPAQDAITVGGGQVLSFPHLTGDGEPSGWARCNMPTGGYEGPNVDFGKALVTPVDVSDPTTVMEIDVRYYQEGAGAYGDAPIRVTLYDANGNNRKWGVNDGFLYQTGSLGSAPYPTWTHLAIPTNNSSAMVFTDGGAFDPTNVTRIVLNGSDWNNSGHDFVDAKNLSIKLVAAQDIGGLKDDPEDTPVTLSLIPVSYSPTMSGTPAGTYFYVEAADRSAGIRVVNASLNANPLAGALANITGTIKTGTGTDINAPVGERYILATDVVGGGNVTVAPLGVNTRTIHEDAKASGELVRSAGVVQAFDLGADFPWFTILDGYTKDGAPIATKVQVGSYAGDPSFSGIIAVGDFVKFNGIVTQDDGGTKIVLLKTFSQADQVMPTPPHTISVGFESGEGYSLGEIVAQTAAWTGTAAVAAVAASPDPAFGAQSLQFNGAGAVDFSTGLAGQTLKYSIVKMHIWRPAGVTNKLTWWGNGTMWYDGGHTDLTETQPIDGSGGAKTTTPGIGAFMELAIMWDFQTQKGSSWINGVLLDNKLPMQGSPDVTQPDINFTYDAGNGSIYLDDISFGYALTSDP